MNLFSLVAKLGLDVSEYESNVEKAGNKFSGLKGKLSAGFGAIKKGAKIMGTVGAAAGSALAGIGLSYNAQMESYTSSFKVMLGSQEDAVKKVEELKKFAAKTPFGMGELAEATQTLLAFQVPAEKSTGIMKMLGDVALGDKEKLKGLALVFGQVSSAGKLQGQDLMQLINQGFNPLNYITKRTGESMEEVRERMSKGGISAQEVEQAFEDATAAGGQFHNGMQEASTTMEGLKSTLEDTVKSKIGEFFEATSEKIKEALPAVIEFVENIDVKEVTEKLMHMMEVVKQLMPVIFGLTAATVAYKAAVSIGKIISAVTKATKGMTAAQAALNLVMMANPFAIVAGLIAGLVTAIIYLWHTNEDFRKKVKEIWKSITGVFSSAWKAIKETFSGWKSYFMGKWKDLKNAFSGAKKWFKDLGHTIVSSIKQGILDKWEAVKSWFGNIWDGLFGGRSVDINVNENHSKSGVDGSHAGGLYNVPFDGYIAELHKGERVLTAREASAYNSGRGSSGEMSDRAARKLEEIIGLLRGLRLSVPNGDLVLAVDSGLGTTNEEEERGLA